MQSVIPAPLTASWRPAESFLLTPEARILVPAGDRRVMALGWFLSDWIGCAVGPTPIAVTEAHGCEGSGHIVLALAPADAARGATPPGADDGCSDEAYTLTITPAQVTIVAAGLAGLFYGIQTLRQLLPPFVEYEGIRHDPSRQVAAPAVTIVDRPRFAWRGAMLDVARHFLTVDEVKRFIGLIALYKMNRLHLHLSDDQGWRIEIGSWPRLAEYGGSTQVGGGRGGHYSQKQYGELVAYAAERFVTIVPEIEMPGHVNAALACYPELNADRRAPPLVTDTKVGLSALTLDRDLTYAFIGDVIREIAAISPGAYFHIGGDEALRIATKDYASFIERTQTIVARNGKTMIGWDEITAANLAATTLVQHWRPGAPVGDNGARIILSMADLMYLDMKYDCATPIGQEWAARISVRRAYDWDPSTMCPDVAEPSIAGVEAALWSETVANIRDAEFLAFPRIVEIAEVGWSQTCRRQWDEFRTRLAAQAPRWSVLGVNFYRAPEIDWLG